MKRPTNAAGETMNTDFEVTTIHPGEKASGENIEKTWKQFLYIFPGILFGIILIKAEVVSWFRIQEMFRLQSFHMYGVIGSAILTGIISIQLIKRFNIKSITGERIILTSKKFHKGQVYGGLCFGLGWALTGACPGPLFAQIGAGSLVIVITLLSAIVGTWIYGWLREKLPH